MQQWNGSRQATSRRGSKGYRKKNKLPPFVPLLWHLLNSAAYKALPQYAAKMLPLFLGKVKLPRYDDPARYSTAFSFTYAEAKRYGCSTATFSKVINDLVRFGFIDPRAKGGLRGGGLTNSQFLLSKRWEHYGTSAFVKADWKSFGIPSVSKKRSRPTAKTESHKTKEGTEKGRRSSAAGSASSVEDTSIGCAES